MGTLAGLGVLEIICEGRNCMDGTQSVRRRNKTVPFRYTTRVDELQPWDAAARKTVVVGGV